jgi:hypothetical protein
MALALSSTITRFFLKDVDFSSRFDGLTLPIHTSAILACLAGLFGLVGWMIAFLIRKNNQAVPSKRMLLATLSMLPFVLFMSALPVLMEFAPSESEETSSSVLVPIIGFGLFFWCAIVPPMLLIGFIQLILKRFKHPPFTQ